MPPLNCLLHLLKHGERFLKPVRLFLFVLKHDGGCLVCGELFFFWSGCMVYLGKNHCFWSSQSSRPRGYSCMCVNGFNHLLIIFFLSGSFGIGIFFLDSNQFISLPVLVSWPPVTKYSPLFIRSVKTALF